MSTVDVCFLCGAPREPKCNCQTAASLFFEDRASRGKTGPGGISDYGPKIPFGGNEPEVEER